MTPEERAVEALGKIPRDGPVSGFYKDATESVAIAIYEAFEEAAKIADEIALLNDRPGSYRVSGAAKKIACSIRGLKEGK